MDVNLTAASSNRKVGKALVRTPAFRRRLTELVAPLRHLEWEFLQVVMHDAPVAHVDVRHVSQGSLGRLLQVGVGIPGDLTFLPPDDAKFVDACAAQLSRVVRRVAMTDEMRAEILRCIEQSRAETRDKSIPHSPLSAKFRSSQ